jgi:LPS O-antigen subunit length determinant protein (WzzB/FepE family)
VDRLPAVGWDEGPGLVASVWRYRWLVAAVALAGALAGYGFSLVQPVVYEASSRILLTSPSGDGGQEPDRFVRNEAAFMVSPPVLDRAVRGVKGRVSVKQLRERLVAEPSTESDLVTLRVRDATAQGAAELVRAVGLAYEATVKELAKAALDREIAQARETQATLREQLSGLNAKLEASPDDATLQSQRDAVTGLLAEAVKREKELQLRGPADDPVALLEQPEVPEEPAQPRPLRLVALGGLLGSVLAAGLAWWLAGRRQAPVGARLQPDWPHPATGLPGTRPARDRRRLARALRSGMPNRGKAPPDTTPSGVRSARAKERLIAVLGSERLGEDAADVTITLSNGSDVANGHHSTGNGLRRVGRDLGRSAEAGGAPEPPAKSAPAADEPNGGGA